jgi:hypothetical protein
MALLVTKVNDGDQDVFEERVDKSALQELTNIQTIVERHHSDGTFG